KSNACSGGVPPAGPPLGPRLLPWTPAPFFDTFERVIGLLCVNGPRGLAAAGVPFFQGVTPLAWRVDNRPDVMLPARGANRPARSLGKRRPGPRRATACARTDGGLAKAPPHSGRQPGRSSKTGVRSSVTSSHAANELTPGGSRPNLATWRQITRGSD